MNKWLRYLTLWPLKKERREKKKEEGVIEVSKSSINLKYHSFIQHFHISRLTINISYMEENQCKGRGKKKNGKVLGTYLKNISK